MSGVSMPTVQIKQQWLKLGLQRQPEKLETEQPRTQMEQTTTPGKVNLEGAMQSPPGQMMINQDRAREALGIGSIFSFNDRIAGEGRRIALEGIARRVEEGNQYAALHTGGGNPVADIAYNSMFTDFKLGYEGPFEVDSVDINFTARPAKIDVSPTVVKLNKEYRPAEIKYTASKVDVHVAQWHSLEFIPPKVDLYV